MRFLLLIGLPPVRFDVDRFVRIIRNKLDGECSEIGDQFNLVNEFCLLRSVVCHCPHVASWIETNDMVKQKIFDGDAMLKEKQALLIAKRQ